MNRIPFSGYPNLFAGEILHIISLVTHVYFELHVKYLANTCTDNYTCDIINYVHIEDNSIFQKLT